MTDASANGISHDWDADDWRDTHTALCELVEKHADNGSEERAERCSAMAREISEVIDV